MYPSITPEEIHRREIRSITREILKDDYKSIKIKSFSIKNPSLPEGEVSTKMTLKVGKAPQVTVSSSGVGIVDSAFQGLKFYLQDAYSSLGKISLESFSVFTSSRSGTSSLVTIVAELSNSYSRVVPFRASNVCLSRAAFFCLASAFEYYINCEETFRSLQVLIKEAESRGRNDISQEYISKIVKIVGLSSYEEIF